MKFVIEKFINDNNARLFLLDLPTGFGKTFTVKKVLKECFLLQTLNLICRMTSCAVN